jgi:hypothetical protein
MVTHLNTFPLLVPIPSFDGHVITSGEYDACSWVHGETSYIIRVSLERGDLLMRIVIEDTQLEVVRASNKPVFSGNKFNTAYRNSRDLESLHKCASFVVVDVDGAVVQTCKQP